ncbi:MAG TPA: transporter substrate-binding domain-containing protein [Ramlibacter sp.]|uniref:transporter substrate-binding domain-containing protein n=1 Tax=Ramlibacter sp. TaxID=1917967 RepID=UPI002BBA88E9|nr:transporter substrate-binding domain-containing protein [Ramlibacter sp.]HVZ43165.1 transporter substrate-binding domain-containing protein [Ramlibacter sp.]
MSDHSARAPGFFRCLALVSVFAACALHTAARADQLDAIKSAGVLKCGIGPGAKPYSFVADPNTRKLVGYDIDICEAVAKSLGVKPELVFITLVTRVTDVQQGRTDLGLAAITNTPERAKQVDFSYNYLVTSAKVAVPADRGYKTFADLAGKRFSATEGANLEIKLPKVIDNPQVIGFPSPANAFLALEQGKVDAMGGDETTLRGVIGTKTDKFQILDQAVDNQQIGLAVRKGEPRLLAEVNRALAQLEQSGEAAEIFDRWFGANSQLRMKRSFRFAPYQGS